jgi:periplasmic protein TonB
VSASVAAPGGSGREALRWAAGLLVVLALHVGVVLWLLARAPIEPFVAAPALMIDLEPAPATEPQAAEAQPAPAPPLAEPEPARPVAAPEPLPPVAEPEPTPPPVETPPPEPQRVSPEPVPEQHLPTVPEAEVALPPPPPKVEKRRPPPPPRPRPARVQPRREPVTTEAPALPPAATAQPAPPAPSAAAVAAATTSWQSRLIAHLNGFKRYPAQAQMRREQGVAYLRFTLNRAGKVLRFSLERGSGHELLDQEALALIQRAQPLPAPPAEIGRETLELVVPLRFHLR